MKEINDRQFSETIKTDKLVIIDLYATWCGPCKSLAPTLEELSKENKDSTEIVKMDIDTNPEILSSHSVRGVPTLLFYKKGKFVDQISGNQAKDVLKKLIDKHNLDTEIKDFGDDF